MTHAYQTGLLCSRAKDTCTLGWIIVLYGAVKHAYQTVIHVWHLGSP